MERISKYLSAKYPPVKLYLSDLLDIEKALRDECASSWIIFGNHKFNSVEELKANTAEETLFELEFEAREPYVTLRFDRLTIHLFSGDDRGPAAAAFFNLDRLLRRTRRRPIFLYCWQFQIAANILIWVLIFIKPYWPLRAGVSLAVLLLVLWANYIRLRWASELVLDNRARRKGFLARNKDHLAVNAIVATITALLTALAATYSQTIHTGLSTLLQR
jgi:hypothetical protein